MEVDAGRRYKLGFGTFRRQAAVCQLGLLEKQGLMWANR
jgi:hypothetical protein